MATHDHDEVRPYASPVCYAHEFETNPLQTAEVIAFLNGLLEGERAGAQGLVDMSKTCSDAALKQRRSTLRDHDQTAADPGRSLRPRLRQPAAGPGHPFTSVSGWGNPNQRAKRTCR